MDDNAFRIYVEHVLAPTLKPGDVLILDNLSAHKVVGIREAIAARHGQVFYLSPYSLDMKSIEIAFARLKALLRHEPARTANALIRHIGHLLHRFAPQECANFFHAARYQRSLAGLDAAFSKPLTVYGQLENTLGSGVTQNDDALAGHVMGPADKSTQPSYPKRANHSSLHQTILPATANPAFLQGVQLGA